MRLLKKIGKRKVSRKTLRVYAFYRKNSLIKNACTMETLIEFHKYESTGVGDVQEMRQNNGWANGKWMCRVNQDMITEDLKQGNICKHELYQGVNGWWYKNLFKSPINVNNEDVDFEMPTFFPFLKENR